MRCLFPILGVVVGIQFLTFLCSVSVGFLEMCFMKLQKFPLIPSSLRLYFNHECLTGFVKCVFFIDWYAYTTFLISFNLLMCFALISLDTEPPSHTWINPLPGSYYIIRLSHCCIGLAGISIKDFTSVFMRGLGPKSFFFGCLCLVLVLLLLRELEVAFPCLFSERDYREPVSFIPQAIGRIHQCNQSSGPAAFFWGQDLVL